MTTDQNKHIDLIKYNHLNLPIEIQFGNGKIYYTYDAAGTKLKKQVHDGGTITRTDYVSGYQYKDNVLQFFPTAEGYVNKEGANYKYVYNYTDHLGNVRLSYADNDGNGSIDTSEILEENNYYAFGLKHNGYNNATSANDAYKYKYQGQERQNELNLNWDSFKWRNYDYAIGRFMSIDPLAEKYTYNSTYGFAENKVVAYVELEGLEGLHHTKTDKHENISHMIEKNVVILTQNEVSVPEINNSGNKKEYKKSLRAHNKTLRKNKRINATNEFRINQIKTDHETFYGGNHTNSKGEKVTFKFNYLTIGVDNTAAKRINGLSYNQFAQIKGLKSSKIKHGVNLPVPAAIFTTLPTGSLSSTSINRVENINADAPEGTVSHETLHTLGLQDNGYDKGGVLNSPPGPLLKKEIDLIIKESYDE